MTMLQNAYEETEIMTLYPEDQLQAIENVDVNPKDISERTKVPGNDKGRLMYYLECVFTVLRMNKNEKVKRLIDYTDCNLTGRETDRLVSLCYLLSPDVLLDKVKKRSYIQCTF